MNIIEEQINVSYVFSKFTHQSANSGGDGHQICPECGGYMLEKDGWLRCSCGFAKKINKKRITPL